MTKEFGTFKVEGNISPSGDRHVEQYSGESLQEELHALLSHPDVKAIRWRQYTPYFNDGEPCVFSVYGVGIDLGVKGEESEGRDYPFGDYEDDFLDTWEIWSSVRGRTAPALEKYKDDAELETAFRNLTENIQGGYYDNVLLSTFGDHAVVTVSADKITIERYDHE